jgi:exosortase
MPSPIEFLICVAISLVIAWRPLEATFTLAWTNDQYTHVLLIIPISLLLIRRDWPTVRPRQSPTVRAKSILLLCVLALAEFVTLRCVSLTFDLKLSICILALVLSWIGLFVSYFGNRVSRSLFFPLCFLLCFVPLPQTVVDAIVCYLQQESAWTSELLFAATHVPVMRNGIVLTIPDLTIEVAKECSSIRSSLVLLVTAIVLAQVFLRSPWRKALVVAMVVPLSVAKNGLRIFTLAMLGTRIDPSFLTGKLHNSGGIVFFSTALAVVCLSIWALQKREPRLASNAGSMSSEAVSRVPELIP